MGFLMDGLDAEAYDRSYSDRQLVRRIVEYFKPQTGRIIIVVFAVVLMSLANTALPIYISHGIDELQTDPSNDTILRLAIIVTILACIGWAVNFLRRWFSSQAAGDVGPQLPWDRVDSGLKGDPLFYH